MRFVTPTVKNYFLPLIAARAANNPPKPIANNSAYTGSAALLLGAGMLGLANYTS